MKEWRSLFEPGCSAKAKAVLETDTLNILDPGWDVRRDT